MKILLSSDYKSAVLGMKYLVKSLENLKVLFIVTASKKKLNLNYLNVTLQYLLEAGCKPGIFDISGVSEEELRLCVPKKGYLTGCHLPCLPQCSAYRRSTY